MKKKNTFDRIGNRDNWIQFLESKGFQKIFDEGYKNEDTVIGFLGCNPKIKIELYSGDYRTDTETGGCICADFQNSWNKVSQCPVYFCDNVSPEKFWSAIELLMDAGIEFSWHCGRIEEGNGYLFCDPPVERHNKEKLCRRIK